MADSIRVRLPEDFPAPPLPALRLPVEAWRNGVAVRVPNWLGDAVMTLPALYQLKKILPKHCGLFIVGPVAFEPLFRGFGFVDEFIGLTALHRRWTQREFHLLRVLRPGVGILFNNSLRDALTFRLAMPNSVLLGASKRGRALVLSHAYSFPDNQPRKLGQLHHANKYLSLVQTLGAPNWEGDLPRFELPIPLCEMRSDVYAWCDHAKLLVLGAGAAYGAAKRWPGTHFREIAARWVESGGAVVTLGSASEKSVCAETLVGLPEEQVANLAGKTDFQEMLALVRSARAVVANDSGIMHLAAALGRPGVAIFGPTDHTTTSPISAKWAILRGECDCAPCFERVCPRGEARCMAMITPDEVWQALQGV